MYKTANVFITLVAVDIMRIMVYYIHSPWRDEKRPSCFIRVTLLRGTRTVIKRQFLYTLCPKKVVHPTHGHNFVHS